MENEMNGQFPWSESGVQLLNEIRLYIKLNGGEKALYIDIISSDRKKREQIYKSSLMHPGRKNSFYFQKRKTKKVAFTKNGRFKVFNSCINAAKYMGVTDGFIRNAIKRGGTCKGWNVMYAHRKKLK